MNRRTFIATAAVATIVPPPAFTKTFGTRKNAEPASRIAYPGAKYMGPYRVWGSRGGRDQPRDWVWEIVPNQNGLTTWCANPVIAEWWDGRD